MKKLSTLILLLLCFALGYGKEVSVETAKTVGYNYLAQMGSTALQDEASFKLIYTSTESSKALFFVFGGDNCFVIVSAEDNVVPVFGYSLHNTFSADHIPDHISGFLKGYNEQVSYVVANKIAADEAITTTWSNLINNVKVEGASKKTAVSPLLSTRWDQSPYYNDYCPMDYATGNRSVTGCVATATAQVMKFWNWPTTGVGFHSYTTSTSGTLSASFSSHTYNWSAMPASVGSTNTAVARLMSDVGISVDMSYSSTSSGAYVISSMSAVTNCAEYALRTYFNYDASLHGEKRASYSDATWTSMLETDLTAGRPIVYAGSGTGGGHCFVLDGFDASHKFHVNWGWGGYSDGYFAINALNPAGTGTGGGSGGYNSNQHAILGVKPAGGGSTSTTADTLALYDYLRLSSSTINYGAAFTITTDILNYGTHNFTGDYCAAAFDYSTGNFVCFIDSIMGVSLSSGYYHTVTFPTTGVLAMLPGTYSIGVFYRPSGSGWNAVWNYSPYVNFVTMTVVNHNPVQLSSAMSVTPSNFVQGSPGSIGLTLRNYMSSTFSGGFDVSLYNLDGSFNSTIQTMSSMTLAPGASTSALTFSSSSITAAPGTYFAAVEYSVGSSWYLAGSDYYTNPIYVTVVAPPPPPDIYEVNNTAATAYTIPLTFSGSTAAGSTPGANFHTTADQDYYKIDLASGYNYAINARINDNLSSDDAGSYSTDASWSYSTDGGTSWSSVYSDVYPGTTFNVSGGTSGITVIFHVTPTYAGDLGVYKLKLISVTRSVINSVPGVDLSELRVFPNPSSDFVTIDLEKTNTTASSACITSVEGKQVYCEDVNAQKLVKLPVHNLAAGSYFVELTTQAGIIRKKITVAK